MPFWKKKKKESEPTAQHNHQHQQPKAQINPQAQAGPGKATVPGLSKIKNIIAVASGKGGVGKSTVSTNLAYALKAKGFKVGLLDADIYGPCQSDMLGAGKVQPMMKEGQLLPVEKHGLKFMSMGVISEQDAPVVWRAPMAMKMIQTFLNVDWGELDYLLIDLPPGTGDVQISLAQQASLSGAIIVSTPQDVALNVALKGLNMFKQVNIPILGLVENMSGFTCSHCGENTTVFKAGGAEQLAQKLNLPFLGKLGLDPEIMMGGETGEPVLLKSTETPAAQAFTKLADNLVQQAQRYENAVNKMEPNELGLGPSGELLVGWHDGPKAELSPYTLRVNCKCANCVDENTGQKTLDPNSVSLDIKILGIRPVGRYGVSLQYSDGHNTGIYTFDAIKQLSMAQNQSESFQV